MKRWLFGAVICILALGSYAYVTARAGAPPPTEVLAALGAEDEEAEGAEATAAANEQSPQRHASALKIINRNLEAVGGAEKLRSINSLIIKGGRGSIGSRPPEPATCYLKAPDHFKQKSSTGVILSSGEKKVQDIGAGETELPPPMASELDLFIPFALKAFSLLAWEEYFDAAEYLGKKRYGPDEQYVILLPKAQNGEDLTVHFDAESYLIDRLTFKLPDPKAHFLNGLSRLRDYKTFDGIKLPTTVSSEKIGWRELDGQFVIEEIQINPEIDDGIFKEAKMDYGTLIREGDSLKGEVRSTRFDLLHSNVSDEDLAAIGVNDGDWISITLGENIVKAKYIKDYTPEPTAPPPTFNRFLIHPRAEYNRMLLLGAPGANFEETFPFKTGDTFVIKKTEPEEPAEEEEKIKNQEEQTQGS